MSEYKITNANFEQEVLNSDKPAIVNATGKVKKKGKAKSAAKKDDKKVLFVPK